MAMDRSFKDLAAMPAVEVMPVTWAWLARYGARLGNVARAAVRDGRLSALPQPSWEAGRTALRRVFGLHDRHFFNVAGHEWLSLTETQTTGGLAHFLDALPAERRRERVAALFAASGSPIDAEHIVDARVIREYPISGGRLDILAWAKEVGGPTHLLVIEGKYEYDLSHNQLRRYERALPGIIANEELVAPTLTLRVVGNILRGRTRKQLGRQKQWRFLSWKDLMLQLDGYLPAGADTDDFRRFRRTLWDRCT